MRGEKRLLQVLYDIILKVQPEKTSIPKSRNINPEKTIEKEILEAMNAQKKESKVKTKENIEIKIDEKPRLPIDVGENPYIRHSINYAKFIASYLYKQQLQIFWAPSVGYGQISEQKPEWRPGDELLSYKRRKNLIRSLRMNQLMGAPVNHIDPAERDLYKFWMLSSKFNYHLSRIMPL